MKIEREQRAFHRDVLFGDDDRPHLMGRDEVRLLRLFLEFANRRYHMAALENQARRHALIDVPVDKNDERMRRELAILNIQPRGGFGRGD